MDYKKRVDIAEKILSEVNEALDIYYEIGLTEKEYFVTYPMMFLEEHFQSQRTGEITGMVEVKLASWLIGEMIKRGAKIDLKANYNEESYQYYKNDAIPLLRELFLKVDTIDEIKDTYSVCSAKITEKNGEYLISKAFLKDKYDKEKIYYDQTFDTEKFHEDRSIIIKSTDLVLKKFSMSVNHPTITFMNHVRYLDVKCYEASKERVEIDVSEWLGRNIKSDIIRSKKELISILGYFHYLGIAYHTRTQLVGDRNFIFAIKEEDLLKKIRIATGLSKEIIKNYIEYFTYRGIGTTNHFPLFESDGLYGFIPSSMILNDWQFSITAGHYMKKIQFKDRDKTISRNVSALINNAIKEIDNIKACYEHYYDLVTQEGNSDIDIAIYCEEQKSLLVIEAKWIDNHYKDHDDEKFSNVYSTVNKIYSKQLSKHKLYLSADENGLRKLFNAPIEVERIEYIAVDKRSQIHTDDMHLLSVYIFVLLIKKYTKNSKLDLNEMLNEIFSLRTSAEYYDLFSVTL